MEQNPKMVRRILSQSEQNVITAKIAELGARLRADAERAGLRLDGTPKRVFPSQGSILFQTK